MYFHIWEQKSLILDNIISPSNINADLEAVDLLCLNHVGCEKKESGKKKKFCPE